MDGNALAGVTLINTDETTISDNNIQGSQNAIFLDSQSNKNIIQLNSAHDNVVAKRTIDIAKYLFKSMAYFIIRSIFNV
jgi:parallel beta-helix repeat protein